MEQQDVIVTWKRMQAGTREALIITGALLFLTAVLLIWAMILRKRRLRHSHPHYHYPSAADRADSTGSAAESVPEARRKSRRRRRDRRPLNPTLSETGGLPPIRQEGPPPMP